MQEMTSRQRVLAAINHKEPDRVPIDLGSTINSSIVYEGYLNLRKFLDLPDKKPGLIDRMMRVVRVEEDLLNKLDTDLRGLFLGPHSDIKEISADVYIDEWGVKREKRPGVYYYEQLGFPLSGDITKKDILDYKFPDPDDKNITKNLKSQVESIKTQGDKAIVITVPSCCIHKSQYLRGFSDWYLDCAGNLEVFETLLDAVFEVNYQVTKNVLKTIGNDVDIVMCSDDLGTQQNLQISPAFFRRVIKPRFKKYFEMIHSLAPESKLAFHTCGNVRSIIGDLIEVGVDILNPVQVSANKMDSKELKEEFGKELGFWGAIDSQSALRGDSISKVREEVKLRIDDLAAGGGYILGAVHNIQPDVPPQNIYEMFSYSKEYSRSKG